MKFKHKVTGLECEGSRFNLHSFGEIVMMTENDMFSDFPWEYDVFLEATGEWTDYNVARKNNLIIPDNYHTYILEPPTEEAKERGYF